jgi:16S rRNA processing protein RimM
VCPGDSGIGRKVLVGVVLKPVGLKGELKVRPISDNPERFEPGGRLWVDDPNGGTSVYVIASVSEHGGSLRVALDGVSDVEEAERLRGREFYVPESEVPPLPEGEYYHYQIIGLSVYTHTGRLLGKVTDIFTAGEKDVYVVKGRDKEYLIPVTEEHVREIDVKAGRITLNPMEGYIPG